MNLGLISVFVSLPLLWLTAIFDFASMARDITQHRGSCFQMEEVIRTTGTEASQQRSTLESIFLGALSYSYYRTTRCVFIQA
jgi:hypothetical protein